MADFLRPLEHSHAATTVEAELKDLFIKLWTDALAPTAMDINVYGAPHLGSFALVERNIDQDGLTVLRETTEARIRYLFKAWRHRNPERGLHFLRLYLAAIFDGGGAVNQLWQKKSETYPLHLRTPEEIEGADEDEADYFLTSRVRVDLDTEIIPAKLLASLRSSVAARILLNVRIGRTLRLSVGVAAPAYGAMVLRLNQTGIIRPAPGGDYLLATENTWAVITEDGLRIRLEGYTPPGSGGEPEPEPNPVPANALTDDAGTPITLTSDTDYIILE